jgi:2,4-dienoyl-CoA reductase-like NADH-dependent reductase (Old Yellow Enzyme family)
MTDDVFSPGRLGPVTLRNRVIKAATFEGASPQGFVTDALIDYHLRVADGGVGMTTVAYLAVSPEGRTDRRCLQLRPETVDGLARLTDAVHRTGAAVAAQIGHAGPVANPKSNRAPALAPSRTVTPSGPSSAPSPTTTSSGSPATSPGPPPSPSTPASTASRSTSATITCSAPS